MNLSFFKYHGAGNDFIIIDNRTGSVSLTNKQIAFLCHRHIGIGADGLMYLQGSNDFDFKMVYFNSDGHEGSMCGNGGRSIVRFAHRLGLISGKTKFETIDGVHEALFLEDGNIKLRMKDVSEIEKNADYFFLNTGSPHYVEFVENINLIDVVSEGRKIRNNERFKEKGTNVNFVERSETFLFVSTYERGVEDETLSCGTGVTAAAIVSVFNKNEGNYTISIETKGGNLKVHLGKTTDNIYKNIWLEGPAEFVFEGKISL